ncbi:MAG: hypothetical protein J07HQW1_03187, partial [Haloquadratum walsbyi J07HQW1]
RSCRCCIVGGHGSIGGLRTVVRPRPRLDPRSKPGSAVVEYFESVEALEPEYDWDVEELLERSQERERFRLEAELQQVEVLLREREDIHEESVEELESKLDWYVERLELEYKRSKNRERIAELKSEIRRFYSELRDLERERWLDVQELERERRRLERELESLSGQELIGELLEE